MAKHTLVNEDEARQIRELKTRIGDVRFRTLLTGEGARLMRPERLSNLSAGRGKLSPGERAQLARVEKNKVAITQLGKRGDKQNLRSFKTNRGIRSWLLHGKERDVKRKRGAGAADDLAAIRALRMLGVDVDAGTFYLKGITS